MNFTAINRNLDRIADGKAHRGLIVREVSYPDYKVSDRDGKTATIMAAVSGKKQGFTHDGETFTPVESYTDSKGETKQAFMAAFRKCCVTAGLSVDVPSTKGSGQAYDLGKKKPAASKKK